MADEVQRLLLEIEGARKLEELNAALAKEKEYLQQLLEIQRQGVVGVNPATIDAAAQSVVGLNKQIAALEAGRKDFSRSALQFSYVLDDLVNTSGSWTQKLASISNNIPGLVASVGLTSGLAGGIGLVSTALIGLAPLARKAWEAFTGPDALPKVMLILDDAKGKVKELQGELDKLTKSQTGGEKETKGLVDSLIEESGGTKAIAPALGRAIGKTSGSAQMTPAEAQQLETKQATIDMIGDDPRFVDARAKAERSLRDTRSRIQKRIDDANLQQAGGLLSRASTSRGARSSIRGLMAGTQFGEGLADVEPEAMKAFDEEVDAQASDAAEAHENRVKRKEAAAKAAAQEKKNQEAFARVRASIPHQIEARNREDLQQGRDLSRGPAHVEAQAKADRRSEAEFNKFERGFTADAFAAQPKIDARRAVVEESVRRGQESGGEVGGMPSPDQADAMADQMLSLQKAGHNSRAARWMAVEGKIRQLYGSMQSDRQWDNSVGMGGDASGQPSAMPFIPYSY